MNDNRRESADSQAITSEAKAWIQEKMESIDSALCTGESMRTRYLAMETTLLEEAQGEFPVCKSEELRVYFHRLLVGLLFNYEMKTRTFQGVRRSDVARLLATEAGYGPEVQVIEETAIVYPSIAQVMCTDMQFLRKLASKEGFRFYVDAEGFHFRSYREGEREPQEMPKVAKGLSGEVALEAMWMTPMLHDAHPLTPR